jgi:IS6 family transposase
MSDFKWRHFQGDIILGCVRWYCKYGISYRDLEEMMLERGIEVDHTTIHRWVIKDAPELEKRLRWYSMPRLGYSLRVDETYIKVKGKWVYLYRAIDKRGHTLDFYLSPTRNKDAAKRFLGKAFRKLKEWEKPHTINTDKAGCYVGAIKELKDEGICPPDLEHRQVKFFNNLIESDHGKLKRLIKPTLGFKSMKTAYATLKGFEVMRMFKKGQMDIWKYVYGQGLKGEIRLVNKQFNIYAA